MPDPSPLAAHPLAYQVIEILKARQLRGPVIEVAAGSGRNTRALQAAGLNVVATSDDDPYTQLPGNRGEYVAALSTHGYLHGAVAKLRAGLAELRRVLADGAAIAITLGSITDARFGFGEQFDDNTFAPGDGEEIGIPHAYFDRDGVTELMRGLFTIASLEEMDVDDIVGRETHSEPAGMRHWFVLARKA